MILNELGISKKYQKTFDLIFIENKIEKDGEIVINNSSQVTLIEVKTTKKKVYNNPSGFFLGATENEFKLAELLGDQYKFCFLCLHPDCTSYKFLSLRVN
ncbi:DUF3883 domain-containing protein [Virgibacillus senegalensis]|uniref:DUF3883 domain-containing protein n=1 Tax=Virgibacillus senegalensis TaxID=1499679 RepID=UPI00069E83E7|nr:DUF3883 domain-containing protein [Virgibacillus senegalensis]